MSLTDAFRQQADSCVRLGSPFMGQLLGLMADHWPTGSELDRFFASFTGDIGPAGASLPLRLAGGLHALVLTRTSRELVELYPPRIVPDAVLLPAILRALREHQSFLLDWTKSAPQTNEVRRSAALIAGARVAAFRFGLPIILSELGASGGLNMTWDRYALTIGGRLYGPKSPALTLAPEWAGPPPPDVIPVVATRAGVDLNPLDPARPSDLLRLTAYLWPDQPERLALTRAAAVASEGHIARADAIDWLEARLAEPTDGHMHLIQHTVAWQYFPADMQARGRALIEAAGAKATGRTPLAWLAMESDGDTSGSIGAALTLRLWPGDEMLPLGRADFHGRWVDWSGAT